MPGLAPFCGPWLGCLSQTDAGGIGVFLPVSGLPGSFLGGWLADKLFGILTTLIGAWLIERSAAVDPASGGIRFACRRRDHRVDRLRTDAYRRSYRWRTRTLAVRKDRRNLGLSQCVDLHRVHIDSEDVFCPKT